MNQHDPCATAEDQQQAARHSCGALLFRSDQNAVLDLPHTRPEPYQVSRQPPSGRIINGTIQNGHADTGDADGNALKLRTLKSNAIDRKAGIWCKTGTASRRWIAKRDSQ